MNRKARPPSKTDREVLLIATFNNKHALSTHSEIILHTHYKVQHKLLWAQVPAHREIHCRSRAKKQTLSSKILNPLKDAWKS